MGRRLFRSGQLGSESSGAGTPTSTATTTQDDHVNEPFTLRLDPTNSAPRAARQAVAEFLAQTGRADLAPDATLLSSELVTNAVLHAGGPIDLTASYRDRRLRLEVHDTSPELPTLQSVGVRNETGRGLRLVDCVASQWGVMPDTDGKTTWFELR
jgi:anti-sigma regulatory factor (Ser/Thr protein kinase)